MKAKDSLSRASTRPSALAQPMNTKVFLRPKESAKTDPTKMKKTLAVFTRNRALLPLISFWQEKPSTKFTLRISGEATRVEFEALARGAGLCARANARVPAVGVQANVVREEEDVKGRVDNQREHKVHQQKAPEGHFLQKAVFLAQRQQSTDLQAREVAPVCWSAHPRSTPSCSAAPPADPLRLRTPFIAL